MQGSIYRVHAKAMQEKTDKLVPLIPNITIKIREDLEDESDGKYAINYTVPLDDTLLMEDPEKRIISDLNIEIKRRLALPNFGLRRFKQD